MNHEAASAIVEYAPALEQRELALASDDQGAALTDLLEHLDLFPIEAYRAHAAELLGGPSDMLELHAIGAQTIRFLGRTLCERDQVAQNAPGYPGELEAGLLWHELRRCSSREHLDEERQSKTGRLDLGQGVNVLVEEIRDRRAMLVAQPHRSHDHGSDARFLERDHVVAK